MPAPSFEEYLLELQHDVANPPPAEPREGRGEIYLETETFTNRLAALNSPIIDSKQALTPLIRDQQKKTPSGAPKPKPPAPSAAVDLPPLEEPLPALPAVEDAPHKQAAPDVKAEARIEIKVAPGPVNASRVPEYYWSLTGPSWPRSVEELIGRQVPPPASATDFDALIRQTLRNEVPGEPHPSHSEPSARRRAVDADPVDLHSGAFTTTVADLLVPSPYFPIEMTRRYRSGRPYFGPFGFGWDHAYNVYLRPMKDGGMAFWTGELREDHFIARDGGFVPCAGMACSLARRPAPGEIYEVRFPGGVTWTFERPAGWTDAERIPLVRIADRHGNFLALAYGPLNRVTSVLDEAGRGLLFRYGQCELLERVTDHIGTRAVTYEHDAYAEHLVRVTLPATAEYPAGIATTYQYDVLNPHPAMQHNILRVSDAAGRLMVENEYAAPEEEWRFNRVLVQRLGGFEYTFDYQQIQYVWPDPAYAGILASRTLVRPPDGALHTYTFNYRGDVLDHRFRLCRDRSFRVVASQYRYDHEGNLVEATEPDGGRTLFTYDDQNANPCARRNLLKVEKLAAGSGPPSRVVMRAWYDPKFQLVTRMEDEDRRETQAVHDFDAGAPAASGRLVLVRRPKVTLADGTLQHSELRFEHNARGQLTAAIAAGGARTGFEHHAGGLKAGFISQIIQDAGGAALASALDYDGAGFPSEVTRPGGRTSRMRYNAQGQVEEFWPVAVDGAAAPVRQWFGDSGAPVRIERPLGAWSEPGFADGFIADTFEQDIQGNATSARFAANTARVRHEKVQPDHAGRPVSQWDAAGARTDFDYDERGLLLVETAGANEPAPLVTRYAYDRAGRPTRREDPDGGVTRFHYDRWGRLRQVDLPTGARQRLAWTSRDLVTDIIVEEPRADGSVRHLSHESFAYDARLRLVGHTVRAFRDDAGPAVPLVLRQVLDADDRPVRLISPRGATAAIAYDGLGRPATTTGAGGAVRTFSYDLAGNPAAMTLEEVEGGRMNRRTTRFSYDARDRLAWVDVPAGRLELEYDERNLVTERREPGGVVTRFDHGPHGELDTRRRDPAGLAVVTSWRYDAAGRVTSVTDPAGEVTRWERDRLGRTRQLTLADGSAWLFEFDRAGRLAQTQSPSGSRTALAYAPGLVKAVGFTCTAGAGADAVAPHTFSYDGLGRLVSAANALGAIVRRYDSLGRVVSEEAQGGAVRFGYDDAAGARTTELPDGRRERVILDADGRPRTVVVEAGGVLGGTPGEVLLDLGYQGSATLLRAVHGNGIETSHGFDNASRPTRIDVRAGTLLVDSSRTYHDAQGRRALQQTLGAPAHTWRFGFDALARVVDARSGFPLAPLADAHQNAQAAAVAATAAAAAAVAPVGEAYQLDAADQRRQRTPAGAAPIVYTRLPGHRIVAENASPIAFHPDGQRAAAWGLAHDIDALGRTVRIRDIASGTVTARFEYDALARIAAGAVAGRHFANWFSGEDWVHQAVGMAGEVRQRSLHPLTGQAFRIGTPAGSLYVHTDAARSTFCVTDEAGTVRERHRFGPFGAPALFAADGITAISPAAAAVPPVWRGMEFLAPANLFVAPARLYDPRLGEFTSRDPLLYADSPSPYAFAGHNPADFADPLGLAKEPLGQGSASPPGDDDFTYTEWAFPDPDRRLLKATKRVDTGIRPLNWVLNKVILPWHNLHKFTADLILAVPLGIDDALEQSPLKQEYQALQAMGPLFKVMGIGATAAELVAGLRYAEALGSTVAWRNLALNLLPSAAGGMGGGALPLVKSATRPRTYYKYMGEELVISDAPWAKYQTEVGSPTGSVFGLVSQSGQTIRTIYLDSKVWPIRPQRALEAKYGNLGQWYKPERYEHDIQQSFDLIDISLSYNLPGAEYAISTELGASRAISTFTMIHPQHLRSGFLIVRWYPPGFKR